MKSARPGAVWGIKASTVETALRFGALYLQFMLQKKSFKVVYSFWANLDIVDSLIKRNLDVKTDNSHMDTPYVYILDTIGS